MIASYTNIPSASEVVTGSGEPTAFTGGSFEAAALVFVALLIVGTAATLIARRRMTR
jgi:hypothetical protein